MNKILAIYDNSDTAYYALDLAVKIANQTRTQLFILNIETLHNEIAVTSKKKREYSIQMPEKLHTNLHHEKSNHKIVLPEDHVILHSEEFDADYILQLSDSLNTSLIIGSISKTENLSDKIFGSPIEKLMRKSSIPVITVSHKFPGTEIKNIALALDLEEDIKGPFQVIFHFANIISAKLHLLYVKTPEDLRSHDFINVSIDTIIEDYRENKQLEFSKTILDSDSAEAGLIHFQKQENIDLIAFITHGKTSIPIISTSFSEKMIHKLSIPAMCINNL